MQAQHKLVNDDDEEILVNRACTTKLIIMQCVSPFSVEWMETFGAFRLLAVPHAVKDLFHYKCTFSLYR